MGSSDRITVPADLRQVAHDTEREFQAADSHVRMAVPLHSVPWLVMTYEELRALPLDNRAGFLVSLIDGRCTVEVLLDVAGIPEDEVCDLLADLALQGAIEFREPDSPLGGRER
ncbi:MAG: hypothetical protein ACRELB_15780 [Polyangiaceae bacterium]